MMKIKLSASAMLLFILLWLPLTAAAEDTEKIPYPPRNFLYVVDCSGSMREYRDALDVGRRMLRDLLPESTTTVIGFNSSASVIKGGLTFGGETTVLAGLEKADQVLKEQWQKMQMDGETRETTVLLFSDMQSTVMADDGKTPLTEDTFQEESARLQDIEDRWSQHILEGDLSFYSLHWPAETADAYTVEFDPSWRTAGSSQRFEFDSTQEILKTCVEAYACVLTGSNEFQWTEPETERKDGALCVPIEESYRTFLYLPQTPGGITGPTGRAAESRKWSLPTGGCMLMLENTKAGTYTLQGDAENCFCLTIPQPQLTVKASPDPVMCYEAVAISVAMSAGDSYLGYDTSNSICLMEICPPQENAIPIAPTYDQERNCYEFTYTPQKQGSYKVNIWYYIQNDEIIVIERTETLEAEPYEIKLAGDTRRKYEDLRLYLWTGLQEGGEFAFTLSDYFQSPYQRLEFTIIGPETPEIAYWEPSSGAEGTVTIQALQAGSALLQCDIAYYGDGASEPEHIQTIELPIQVSEVPPNSMPIQIPLIVVGLAVTGGVCGFVLYRRKPLKSR